MKMNKLFSSIATATMVLTTLAPVAVANAATGYPVTDNGVSGTQSTDTTLPAATDSKENSDSGSVIAKSDASVNVIDGYLILQSVPNFGFGASIAGNTTNLVNYKKANQGANDSSDSGLLTILDSRHSATPTPDASGKATAQDGRGFTLDLQLGNFKHAGSTTPSSSTGTEKFTLNFVKGAEGLQEQYNKNNKYTRLEANPISLEESASEKTLVTAASQKSGGNHTWAFTGKDVNLYVPSTASKGQWYATMTWTLSATPAAS